MRSYEKWGTQTRYRFWRNQGASINASLDKVYERMFKRAKRIAKRSPDNVDNGIQVIVFGVFLLEAVCNDLYKGFLSREIADEEFANAIWDMTKRLAILEKLKAVSRIAPLNKTAIDEQMNKLKNLYDLRGRLAHFKDSDTPLTGIDFNDASEEMLEKLLKIPDPELMKRLTGQQLLDYISDIDGILKWFDQIFRIQRKKVKSLEDLVES
ncbi:MAG: hypothetical protein AB1631_07145 [Acidobacteriota bacterium]